MPQKKTTGRGRGRPKFFEDGRQATAVRLSRTMMSELRAVRSILKKPLNTILVESVEVLIREVRDQYNGGKPLVSAVQPVEPKSVTD